MTASEPASAPPALNAMAFFDGQNLYRHAMEAFGHHHPNYDPTALHRAVCAHFGFRPTLVRFYTGVPDVKYDAPWAAYWSNRVLAMKRSGVHVTTRPVKYREKQTFNKLGEEETVLVPQEKGIDVRIAVDVISLTFRKQFDVAIVFSQDQDLNEISEEVRVIADSQNRQVRIICAFPGGPNASFNRGIKKTTWFPMDQEFYDGCLDPRDYRSKP